MFRTPSRVCIAIAGLTVFTATVSSAQKNQTDTPAIITYSGSPSSPFAGTTQLRFYSDGLGSYVDGIDGVSAFYFPSGNAGLNTESSTTRALMLDLSVLAPNSSPSAGAPFPFGNGTVGSVRVNLSQQLLSCSSGSCAGLLGMPPGATGSARIGLTFPDPQGRAYLWTIKWGSGVTNSAYACNLFTSRSVDGITWTIDNIDPSSTCDYAELDYQSTAKGKSGTPIVVAYYDLPFQFTIQKNQ